jgi:hypothetical protein
MKLYPKWLAFTLFILSLLSLSAYATLEVVYDEEVELYRYILTFIFGLMFYKMANKKEQ